MRKFFLLFFMFCLASTIKSQAPADAIAPEDAASKELYPSRGIPRVSGKLLNLSADELKKLTISYTLVTPFSAFQVKKTVSPRPDGSFRLQLDYALPYQQIWISVGDPFYAGIYVNQDLYLELDMKKIKAAKEVEFNGDGVRYLGTDGPLNVYLNNYVLYKRPEQLQLFSDIMKLLNSSRNVSDTLLSAYNILNDSLKKIEESYVDANPSPYSWILENERMSEYYESICPKYWGRIMDDTLWEKMRGHKSYLISNNGALFYKYLANYVINMPGGLTFPGWKDVALLPDLDATEKAVIDSLRVSEKMQPTYPYSPENIKKWTKVLQPRIEKLGFTRLLEQGIRRLDSLFPTGKADFLKLGMNTSTDLNEQKIELEYIIRSMHTDWSTVVLKNEYRRTASKIDEINKTLRMSEVENKQQSLGTPLLKTAFGATLYKAPDMKALDFLEKLKQGFPGKAIIIDRWATWCGPCLSEMPQSKKLWEESKDLPVVFVYLCTSSGSSETKWKMKVMELEQPGIHFFIDEKLDAELSNYFSFLGYPGYALINKGGIYKPGAIQWMSNIQNREALATLINQ